MHLVLEQIWVHVSIKERFTFLEVMVVLDTLVSHTMISILLILKLKSGPKSFLTTKLLMVVVVTASLLIMVNFISMVVGTQKCNTTMYYSLT